MAADDVADIVLSAAVFFEIFGTGDFDVVTHKISRFLTVSINFSTAIFFRAENKQTILYVIGICIFKIHIAFAARCRTTATAVRQTDVYVASVQLLRPMPDNIVRHRTACECLH